MLHKKLKQVLLFSAIFLLLTVVALSFWVRHVKSEIRERIAGGWFKPPVEMYSRGDVFQLRQKMTAVELIELLTKIRYRERFEDQALRPNDFAVLNSNQCSEIRKDNFDPADNCVYFRTVPHKGLKSETHLVGFSESGEISVLMSGEPLVPVTRISLSPHLYAQFYADEPILRNLISIGDAPLYCLQAVTAIEDSQFLEHKGVSVTGFFRAAIRNLLAGRYAQGGSTITQQLVKNYFLTPEKTIRRKISEIVIALVLEGELSKDQIIENYLNVIYMGQSGPFQVIGLGAASDHYLGKPLADLNLSECSLLAAIINNPGRFNPFHHPDNAKKRRDAILDRMAELQMIDVNESAAAKVSGLPTKPSKTLSEPAPYFTQAIFRELKKLNLSTENGLSIYTSLDERAQELAQKLTASHLKQIETRSKSIAANSAKGLPLEATLIAVEVESGQVLALVGGRKFAKTQFNRILDAHRQVGSIMKPFVYLTALLNQNSQGVKFNPLSTVEDIPFVYSYEGQKWSPKNYTKEFYGRVPLFFALKNSLNAATAQLGLEVGLNKVVEVAKSAGINQSELKPFPSLLLGAFEIYPWEMASAYLTLARFGEKSDLSFIDKVELLDGAEIYRRTPEREQVFPKASTAELISMMKQTLVSGTAQASKLMGFDRPAAGKTGTTSDLKDTWFAGFTPQVLTIAWTGYDDNTTTGLTGASGALPLWVEFMKAYSVNLPADDFSWPEGGRMESFDQDRLRKLFGRPESAASISTTDFYIAD